MTDNTKLAIELCNRYGISCELPPTEVGGFQSLSSPDSV